MLNYQIPAEMNRGEIDPNELDQNEVAFAGSFILSPYDPDGVHHPSPDEVEGSLEQILMVLDQDIRLYLTDFDPLLHEISVKELTRRSLGIQIMSPQLRPGQGVIWVIPKSPGYGWRTGTPKFYTVTNHERVILRGEIESEEQIHPGQKFSVNGLGLKLHEIIKLNIVIPN